MGTTVETIKDLLRYADYVATHTHTHTQVYYVVV
jgi:hypothetical protein